MWKALINLVNKWAYRCEHDWTTLGLHQTYRSDDTEGLPISSTETFVCTKCMKSKKITK